METRQNTGDRSTVTESVVWEACELLAAEHKRDFSCKEVRNELGQGSMTTIHRYVKTWREAHPAPPDVDGIPSEQFLAAFKAELKRNSKAQDDKYKIQFTAISDDNEYLYKVLGETEKLLDDAEADLKIQQRVIESQKLQIEALRETNEKLKIAISELQEKQLKTHEGLGRLEIRLERIPFLEKQNGDLQASLEKERTTNTTLVADLAASKAILAHLKDPPIGSDYAARNKTVEKPEATSIDKQRITAETEALTKSVEDLVTQAPPKSKGQILSDRVIAASLVAISDSGPMATKDIHKQLLDNKIIHAEQVSVKGLAAHLRGSSFLAFDTASGSWALSPSEHEFKAMHIGVRHEAT